MTYYKLHSLLLGAQDCADLDTYIAECGGSVPPEYIGDDGDASAAIELLTVLWQFRDGIRFRQLRDFSGMYIAEFSRHYAGMPQRSIEDWNAGKHEPPQYLLELLLADILNSKKAED